MLTLTLPMEASVLQSAATMLEEIAENLADEELPEEKAALEPTPTPAMATASTEVDSGGVPWDPRIHSGKKSKLARTGRWKRLRGIDKVTADTIEAKLMGSPEPVPAPAPVIPAGPATFPELMKLITETGLNPDQIQACVMTCGLPNLPALASKPELIPQVAECIKQTVPL